MPWPGNIPPPLANPAPPNERAYQLQLELEAAEAELKAAKAEIEELRESAEMACESPCGKCAGCAFAEEVYGER